MGVAWEWGSHYWGPGISLERIFSSDILKKVLKSKPIFHGRMIEFFRDRIPQKIQFSFKASRNDHIFPSSQHF